MTEQSHSEAERDEAIGKLAKGIAEHIAESIMTDDEEAKEIAGDLFGCMEAETAANILRLMMSEYPTSNHLGRMRLLHEMEKTITKTAEHRATRQIEEEGE